MISLLVELSGENRPLARAELSGALETLGGRLVGREGEVESTWTLVEVPDEQAGRALAGRLALAHRIVREWDDREVESICARLRRESEEHPVSAAIRSLGRPEGRGSDGSVRSFALAWISGGGSINLSDPERRFYLAAAEASGFRFAEELAVVDRRAFGRRRMPNLPFQRPVSLPPKLARAAANLARIRPGDRVVDPFVGTGALLVEAGLLGARVSGIDHDPVMVKGAIRNLSHFDLEAERLVVADSADAAARFAPGSIDAVLTDPPYGRASGSGGEEPQSLVHRILPAWAALVRPGGRVVVVLPGGPDPLSPEWRLVLSLPDRVHRSLTREFRVYERAVPV